MKLCEFHLPCQRKENLSRNYRFLWIGLRWDYYFVVLTLPWNVKFHGKTCLIIHIYGQILSFLHRAISVSNHITQQMSSCMYTSFFESFPS